MFPFCWRSFSFAACSRSLFASFPPELIITAGGENIAPVAIEDRVKEALPIVSQCMLIGDKMKFLSLLLTLKVQPQTMGGATVPVVLLPFCGLDAAFW